MKFRVFLLDIRQIFAKMQVQKIFIIHIFLCYIFIFIRVESLPVEEVIPEDAVLTVVNMLTIIFMSYENNYV